jgi:hypothetical protein
MLRMFKKEIKEFLVPGTFTAKHASIKKRWKSIYDKRNSTKGTILVWIKPTKIIAEKDTAEWEWYCVYYFDYSINWIEWRTENIGLTNLEIILLIVLVIYIHKMSIQILVSQITTRINAQKHNG